MSSAMMPMTTRSSTSVKPRPERTGGGKVAEHPSMVRNFPGALKIYPCGSEGVNVIIVLPTAGVA
jgi:hypothetical protein